MTPKENFLETLKPDGKPERLVPQYDAIKFVVGDPCMQFCRGNRKKGETSIDKWGVTMIWPEDQFAAMPHVTDENKVCPDVCEWAKYVKVPDIYTACDDPALWEDALAQKAAVNRDEYLVGATMATGVFERMHFLMGFEDVLLNVLLEPEAMCELADAIGDARLAYAKVLVEHLRPDVIVSMDDWGSKQSMFMSPETWRTIIKPQYEKIYGYLKSEGIIILHHSDSFLEPIVEDMIDVGIDVWQGTLPTNDIVKLQKQLGGRLTMMGGIDSVVDRIDATEEEIRAEARAVCEKYGPGGHFIPSMTYGSRGSVFDGVYDTLSDEIERYNVSSYSSL